MPTRRLKIANLDDDSLKRVRSMEDALGTLILALEPHYPLAELTPEQIKALKELEAELGVILIAYQS